MITENDLVGSRWPVSVDKNGRVALEEGDFYTLGFFADEDDEKIQSGLPTSHKAKELKDTISLILPRIPQRTIAPGRDFYVAGYLHPDCPLGDDAKLYISLSSKDGSVVRELFCEAKDDTTHMYVEHNQKLAAVAYANEKRYDNYTLRKVARQSCCPGLVCSRAGVIAPDNDPYYIEKISDKTAFSFTWNKAYYTDTFFAGVIYGGQYGQEVSHEDICLVDRYGQKIEPLKEGKYLLSIELKTSSGRIAAYADYWITIGYLKDKVLSTFSYDYRVDSTHIHNLELLEKRNNNPHILLWDMFPGIWTSALIYKEDNPATDDWENPKTSRLRKFDPNDPSNCRPFFSFVTDGLRCLYNDLLEYRKGKINIYNYGVMQNSIAFVSEYAQVLKARQNNADISIAQYAYKYGEPYFSLDDQNRLVQSDKYTAERFTELTDYVTFQRIEVSHHGETVRYPFTSMLHVDSGDEISLFGICSFLNQPYPMEAAKVSYGFFYNELERIVAIHYSLRNDKNEILTRFGDVEDTTKNVHVFPVKLTRSFELKGDIEANKTGIFEFKHVFRLPTVRDLDYNNLLSEKVVNLVADYYVVNNGSESEPNTWRRIDAGGKTILRIWFTDTE